MRKQVNWIHCQNDQWIDFCKLNVQDPWFKRNDTEKTGVYLIWSDTENRMVYVGSGNILTRLQDHLNEQTITQHPGLKVTFAEIADVHEMQGAENYLAYVYRMPTDAGRKYPNVTPTEVNLPSIGLATNPPCPPASLCSDEDSRYQVELVRYQGCFHAWATEQHGDKKYARPNF